tara:strand:+ start:687 stop:1454 length:768 start_codon:yes stop_codon:yes gene_type:complete
LEEVVTKKFLSDQNDIESIDKDIILINDILMSNPLSLRFWSSFFVILPIFFQAPWVRFYPTSALLFTFFILIVAFALSKKLWNKWFIVGSLLFGVGGSWLGGCLFWGWLSSHPVLHIPVEAVALPLALVGLGSQFKIGSSFYISSLFGTAITDLTILCTGIMDQWMEVINADSEQAPQILQRTSENLIHIKPLIIILSAAIILWIISKIISNFASFNSHNGMALMVAKYVLQTTLIVDGIFIFLALVQPKLSGLV